MYFHGILQRSDAVQMIFSMHCCLHLIGQAVSVGNVDRLLVDYYERDVKQGKLTPEDVCASVLFVCLSLQLGLFTTAYTVGCLHCLHTVGSGDH